jgi:crotonobetainyl-CoA:carnitine CoA-transferase CaiB-like acyl-CoA transferase
MCSVVAPNACWWREWDVWWHREPPEPVLQSAESAGAADMLVEVEQPDVRGPCPPTALRVLFAGATVAEPGVLAGQHTDGILSELGYSAEAIADLRERKVVA